MSCVACWVVTANARKPWRNTGNLPRNRCTILKRCILAYLRNGCVVWRCLRSWCATLCLCRFSCRQAPADGLWSTWWQDRTVSPFRTSGGANVEPIALPLVPHNKYLRSIDGFILPPPAITAAYKRQLSWDDDQVLWYSVRLSVCMSAVPPSHFEAEEVPTPVSELGDMDNEIQGTRASPVPIGFLSSLPPPPSSRGVSPSHESLAEEKSEEIQLSAEKSLPDTPGGDHPVVGNAIGFTLLPPPPPRMVAEVESPTSQSEQKPDVDARSVVEASVQEAPTLPHVGEDVVATTNGAAGSPVQEQLNNSDEKSDEPTSPVREAAISSAVESPPPFTDPVPSSQTAASLTSVTASPMTAIARPRTPGDIQPSRSPVPLPRTPIPAHFVLKRWSHHPSDVAPEIQYSPLKVAAPLNLSRLGLSTTTLSSFTLGGFIRVRCLNLSRNKLTDITPCGFQLMKSLVLLDLHDNNIT